MTAWKLVPVPTGVHIITRVFAGVDTAHLVNVGELELRREEFADLAAQLGAPDAFDTATGRPLTVTVDHDRAGRPLPFKPGPMLAPKPWRDTPVDGQGGI